MPVVSLAEVLVTPTFTGTQAAITKHLGPAAEKAGRRAGSAMGKSMAEGLAAETPALEAEAARLGKAVSSAQDKVTASRTRSEAAAAAERNALGSVRVAELKLAETRENAKAKASQIAAAEERLSATRAKAASSTQARVSAEQNLTSVTKDLGTAQHFSARASENLATHLKSVSAESANTERSFGRLSSLLSRSFRGRPLAEIAQSVRDDTQRINFDLHNMAQNVSQQGTKGGRAFTQAFVAVVGGLSVITPAAGAAGSALLAATGSVVTLAGSIKELAGVSALAPAALIAVGAGAGVLKAAFSGVGEALKEFTDLAKRPINAGANPRIAAMAIEDALRGVANAERNAADARSQSARRVEDAQRSLQDAQDAVADAARDAAEAQVRAAQRVEEAQRDLQDAQRAAVDAARDAAQAQVMAARRVEDAQRSLQDAIEGAADAQIGAARAVERAERDEVRAARDVAEAQKDLGEARDEAFAQVSEAGRDSFDADRDAVDSALEYKKAVETYNAAKVDPDSSADTIAQLNNNVAKAYAADRDAQDAVLATKQAHEKAKREATAGSEAVLKAEQRVADARQAEADAVQARKDAQEAAVRQQRDGARSIEEAQLAVTDAIREQGQAADDAARAGEEAARRITDAQQGVAEAITDVSQVQEDATTAREEADRRVTDAQQGVTDAVAESARAQEDAVRGIEDATRNLERTQLQQGDAAEQAGLKSEAAMARLTPAAQTAVGALLAIYDQLGGIRDIAQENFFAGFTAPLQALADTVLPQLATGVGAIATAFGGGAQQLLTSLSTALGGGVLEGLLLGVAETIGILNGAIDPIVQSFITLGVVGMDYLPQLATAIRDAATQFNTFIQGAAADGSLRGWIDAGLQGFRDVASILGSVVGIFGSLADAARAGGIDTTLGSIAAGLNSVETAMQGEAFQTTMATIFAGAAAGAQGLASALGPVGEAFRTGAPALAEFLRLGGEIAGTFLGGVFTALSDPDFGSGLITFMEALQRGVGTMVPLLPQLTGAFGLFLTALAPIVEVLGPSLIQVFTAFATGIATLLTVLSPLLVAIAGSPLILGLLIGAFTATAAASAALTLAGNIQIIAMKLWAIVTGAVSVAQGILAAATGAGTAALAGNTAAMVGYRIAALAGAAATGIATAAAWLFNGALAGNTIALVVIAVAGLVAGLVYFFTQTEIGQRIVQAAWAGIQDAIGAVVNWFTTVAKPAIDVALRVLGDAFTWLYENVIKPVFAGIQAFIGAWWAVVSGIFDGVVGFVRDVLIPGFQYFSTVLGIVFDAIGQLIGAAWRLIIKPILEAVVGFLQDKLGPVFTWLRDNIIGPVWDFISSKISDVWNNNISPVFEAIKTAVGLIPAAFEAAKNGIASAWEAIQNAVKGPVEFVINKVINEGLIGTFNQIPGVDIQPIPLPPGFNQAAATPAVPKGQKGPVRFFRKGGYTGDMGVNEAAGIVEGREFVFTAEQTAALGKENLASIAHAAVRGGVHGAAASAGEGNLGGFFEGNASAIRRHGAYYLDVASGMDGWNFGGAAKLWDGAAGVKVATGRGQLQGRVSPLERGGGILGYTVGNNIDMSPSWMSQLAPKQRLTVAAHEVGHALGLPHNSLSSIMQPNLANMAATPTAVDIRNLQSLFPGGSGKAGEGSIENPFDGLVDNLMGAFKAAFPGGGMFIDAAGGLAKTGIGQIVQWVSDIKEGIKNIAGNVVNSIKGFFGGGAATVTPNLYDQGGDLPTGISQVLNQTGRPEKVLTTKQWRDMHYLATERRLQPETRSGVRDIIVQESGDPFATATNVARIVDRAYV